MDSISTNLLGIDKVIWEQIQSREKLLYKLIAIILLIISLLSIISMSFIGYAVVNNWLIAIIIGLFFSFLFFNIYRFALVSIGIVLGKRDKNQPEINTDKLPVQQSSSNRIKFPKISKFIQFSTIIRFIVICLIAFIICFGWNLAILWSEVINYNLELAKTIRTTSNSSNTIFLSQTAIYITKQSTFIFWLCLICGSMLISLRLKKQLLLNPKYQYFKLAKAQYENQIAQDYLQLAQTANSYFSTNNILYELDSIWKNPPYKTELKTEFISKSLVDIYTLTNGK